MTVKLKRKPDLRNFSERVYIKARGPLAKLNKEGIRMRKGVTRYWSSDSKPTFESFVELNGSIIDFGISINAPNAPAAAISVWRLLNDGTDVKRVLMTPDFERKTQPRSFASGKGVGSLATVNRNFNYPGIEKGAWDEEANSLLYPEYVEAILDAIRRS